jgi:hypothetical protein
MKNCPKCKSSWDGGSILETFIQQRNNGHAVWKDLTDQQIEEKMKETYNEPYRWGRQISVYSRELDKTVYWKCPDCNTYFDRKYNEVKDINIKLL